VVVIQPLKAAWWWRWGWRAVVVAVGVAVLVETPNFILFTAKRRRWQYFRVSCNGTSGALTAVAAIAFCRGGNPTSAR